MLFSTICSCIVLGILKRWACALAVQGTNRDVALEYLIIFMCYPQKYLFNVSAFSSFTVTETEL